MNEGHKIYPRIYSLKYLYEFFFKSKRRNRTIYAPIQEKNYGPKATLKKVTDDYLL